MRERLLEIMRILKLRNESLAYIMKVSPEQISQYLSFKRSDQGHIYSIEIKKMILLLKHFPDINANYLLTGKGKPFLSDKPEREEELENTIKALEDKISAYEGSSGQDPESPDKDDLLKEELNRIKNMIVNLLEELSEGDRYKEAELLLMDGEDF